MSPIRSGLRLLRWFQLGAWAGLLGIVVCFLALAAFEQRRPEWIPGVKGLLIVFVVIHLAAVWRLRTKRCPACGERFTAAGRAVGSFTAMTQRACQHCGATLDPMSRAAGDA